MPTSSTLSTKVCLLIVGSGYVGTAVAERAIASGWEVSCLRRTRGAAPLGAREIVLDINDPKAELPLDLSFDYVVYSVAADGSDESSYKAAYVDGVRATFRLLERTKNRIRRFLYISSTAVFPQIDGSVVDEESPVGGDLFTSKALLLGEKIVSSSGLPFCILRLGGIYGPGREYFLDQVRKRAIPLTEFSIFTNRIHRDDCAGAILHLLQLDCPLPCYIGVDEHPTSRNDVVEWLSNELSLRPPALEKHTSEHRGGNKQCSSRRLRESGYKFLFPSFREGYSLLINKD